MTDDKSQSSRRSHATSTSRSLIVRVKDNDGDAWDRLVSLYAPLICHWCRKQGLPEHDMPDVVQEVFKSVAENIDRFQKKSSSDTLRGWLRVITRNKVTDHYRRQGKQADAAGGTAALHRFAELPDIDIDQGATDSVDDDADEEGRQVLFQQAMKLIKEGFRERTWQAFWRVVVDECTPKDVAEELGMSPGAVRVAKSRVLQRLRQELDEV